MGTWGDADVGTTHVMFVIEQSPKKILHTETSHEVDAAAVYPQNILSWCI